MSEKSDFENWPLNRGWSLNTRPLYTGSTVIGYRKSSIKPPISNKPLHPYSSQIINGTDQWVSGKAGNWNPE